MQQLQQQFLVREFYLGEAQFLDVLLEILRFKYILKNFQAVLTHFIVGYIKRLELPLLVKALEDVAQSFVGKAVAVEHQNFDSKVLKFFREHIIGEV